MTDHEQTMTDDPREIHSFDESVQEELDRTQYGTVENAAEGEILGTNEWEHGEPLTLYVSIPVDPESPIEIELEMPPAGEPLDTTKFGRVLADHGHTREQASLIQNEYVDCIYREGEWRIVDPDGRLHEGVGDQQALPEKGGNEDHDDVTGDCEKQAGPEQARAVQNAVAEVEESEAEPENAGIVPYFSAILGSGIAGLIGVKTPVVNPEADYLLSLQTRQLILDLVRPVVILIGLSIGQVYLYLQPIPAPDTPPFASVMIANVYNVEKTAFVVTATILLLAILYRIITCAMGAGKYKAERLNG